VLANQRFIRYKKEALFFLSAPASRVGDKHFWLKTDSCLL
jgi:hypothetical protein